MADPAPPDNLVYLVLDVTVGTEEKELQDLADLLDNKGLLEKWEVLDRRDSLGPKDRRDKKDRGCQVSNMCIGNATLVYSGIMGGEHYNHYGGGSNYLCLPNNPIYTTYVSGWQTWAAIFGTEYESLGFKGFKNNLQDHEAPCAVCYVKSRGSQLMIPARNVCPSGWTREYHGYLMTTHYAQRHSSDYVCVDGNAEVVPGTQSNADGSASLLYVVQSHCGALPCQPYVHGRELTCAVCTK